MKPIQPAAAVKRVMDLIAIPGGSCRESAVSDWIQSSLKKSGVPAAAITTDSAHKKSPSGGETGNLIVKLPGTEKQPRRLLMAHMDTVPLAVGCKPVRKGETIRPASRANALGGDNRSGCAVVLTAISEILKQKLPHPPLTLLFTVQEEIGLRGARYLTASKLGKPELCFNWDGRDPASLTIGAVGASYLQIDVSGIPSHAGVHPERGVNAAIVAAVALADLQENGWHGLVNKGKQHGTSNVGVISGGSATNVVMPELSIEAETRSHQSKFRDRITTEFRKAFEKAVRGVKTSDGRKGELSFSQDVRYEAFRIKDSAECVKMAAAAVEQIGLTPQTMIGNGGLDANWMSAHGFPTVTLGCGQHDIHTVDETLDIPEFLNACEVAMHLATG